MLSLKNWIFDYPFNQITLFISIKKKKSETPSLCPIYKYNDLNDPLN